jgi:UDP-2,4-diacetamido-2,4,6-trideoxy-beta-L-altropyranose hydrolase
MAASAITLRPATLEDCEMVLQWRNDPFIVAHGSWRREIQREEHLQWFAETVRGSTRRMYIILHADNPVGQIRFDRENQMDCVISVYLMQPYVGRGWGTEAIRIGCREIFQVWDVTRLIACVREDNPAGRAAFLKASFREQNGEGLCPPHHYCLILPRETTG